jgi:hypothetical protein
MNGTHFEEDAARPRLTQAEAAEMIELWTRNYEVGSGELVDLRDVVEALHISEAEGQRLLSQIRQRTTQPTRPLPSVLAAGLYLLLGASVLLCLALVLLMIVSIWNGSRPDPGWLLLFAAALAWSVTWISYYRRAIGRTFRRIVRGSS